MWACCIDSLAVGDRHNAAEDEDEVDIELSNGRYHTGQKMLLKKLKFKINITLMLSSKTLFGVYLFKI